jgi:hypothetical protein
MPNQSTAPGILLWLTMCIKPRETIRKIVKSISRSQMILLAALIGIDYLLDQMSTRNVGDFLPFSSVLAIALIGGPVIGVGLVSLFGAILSWTGKRLGGQATAAYMRAAYAWSWIPNLLGLVLWLPQLILFGTELFTTAKPKMDSSPMLAFIFLGILGIGIVTSIWSFILLLVNISELQGFSILRALGSLLLSLLVLFVPVLCVFVLLSGFGLHL